MLTCPAGAGFRRPDWWPIILQPPARLRQWPGPIEKWLITRHSDGHALATDARMRSGSAHVLQKLALEIAIGATGPVVNDPWSPARVQCRERIQVTATALDSQCHFAVSDIFDKNEKTVRHAHDPVTAKPALT
jgi:hypothetical protein